MAKDVGKSGEGVMKWVTLGLFVLFLMLVGFLAYFMYMNMPGTPEKLKVITQDNNPVDSNVVLPDVKQFYPNMKFNHNEISYNLDVACSKQKQDRVLAAFDEISNEVGVISFYYNSENPDIDVSCSENEKAIPNPGGKKQNYFIAGEGGAKEIIETGRYNVILNGIVLLYNDLQGSLNCDKPNVEVHELMHVLGFNHSTSKNSLMYPLLESCDQKIDDSIITELKRLYSQENLPDLYFENVSAVKKGRYLDFNLTIRNSGDVDATDVNYSIFDDGELVETRHVGDLKFGAGVSIQIENLRLIHRDPSEIKFVIDKDNKIKEITKSNNVVLIKLTN